MKDYSSDQLSSILVKCCLESKEEQIVCVDRVFTNEICGILKSHNDTAIKECCDTICKEDGVLMTLINRVSTYKAHLHSDWFLQNPGHFVSFRYFILSLAIECNALCR